MDLLSRRRQSLVLGDVHSGLLCEMGYGVGIGAEVDDVLGADDRLRDRLVPDDLVARLEGKSSLGRLGLLIHSTAGFVDAGFDGQLTLELSNVANLPITLYPNMKIGQISFQQMTTPADTPYGSSELKSKYKHQQGPMPSRYWENFD